MTATQIQGALHIEYAGARQTPTDDISLVPAISDINEIMKSFKRRSRLRGLCFPPFVVILT